jgi:hypothetical protein
MEAEEFYELAKDPNFPDEMGFDLTHENDDPSLTFSFEGIENVVDCVQDFIIARIHARWKMTGRAPKRMRVITQVEWDPKDRLADGSMPYYEGFIEHGSLQIDGEHRRPRSRKP